MKKNFLTSLIALVFSLNMMAQTQLVEVEKRTFKITKKVEIEGEVGYLEVPENRQK